MNSKGTVLVTGGGKRIGAAISRCFAQAGYRVVVHYNQSRQEAEALAGEIKGLACQANFLDMAAVLGLLPRLAQMDALPSVLVNSASTYRRARLLGTTPELLQEMFAVNFSAPFELMRSFAELSQGCIINITDQRVAFVDPHAGAYALAKKALRDATEAAALEWAPRVRVNAVAPGLVMEPPGVPKGAMDKLLPAVPMRQRTSEQAVAQACLYLAENEAVTGQTLYLDGGLHLLGHGVETVK